MLRSLLDIMLPDVCPMCEGEARPRAEWLCLSCSEKLLKERISGPVCVVCGAPFSSPSSASHTCGACLLRKRPFSTARSLLRFTGDAASAIHSFKYSGRVTLARPLGSLLLSAASSIERPDCIAPVPLHRQRLRQRGFNQSLLLARVIGSGLSIKVDFTSLQRTRVTEPQVNLSSEEREGNVKGAFTVKDPSAFRGKRVLLVDDVLTTGATITECGKALKASGAEVFALTLARTVMV